MVGAEKVRGERERHWEPGGPFAQEWRDLCLRAVCACVYTYMLTTSFGRLGIWGQHTESGRPGFFWVRKDKCQGSMALPADSHLRPGKDPLERWASQSPGPKRPQSGPGSVCCVHPHGCSVLPLAKRRPGGRLRGVKLVCPDTTKASWEDRLEKGGRGPCQLKASWVPERNGRVP